MRLTPVESALVAAVWPVVGDWIEDACRRVPSELTPDGLRAACAGHRATLVLIGADALHPVAAGVIEVRTLSDGGRTCWILALGGSGLRAWRDTLQVVEDGARAQGCATVEFMGRAGWGRVLPDYAREIHYSKRL